ncbi:ATP-binding protein [Streptomyces sp. NPDC091281]|uniref:ATP-binding protein n=1 Tax=Streptomyces sp. NPDC091281 TaxID=3365985 RepID=UPI00380EF8AA
MSTTPPPPTAARPTRTARAARAVRPARAAPPAVAAEPARPARPARPEEPDRPAEPACTGEPAPAATAPASCAVTLPHSPHAPAIARHVSERWLTDTGAGQRVTDAVLVVSELVTNAVRHTADTCLLTLTVLDGRLDIAVADHGAELPELDRRTAGDERGGFGLALVRALGDEVRLVPALDGKTVHVLLDAGAGHETPGAA